MADHYITRTFDNVCHLIGFSIVKEKSTHELKYLEPIDPPPQYIGGPRREYIADLAPDAARVIGYRRNQATREIESARGSIRRIHQELQAYKQQLDSIERLAHDHQSNQATPPAGQ